MTKFALLFLIGVLIFQSSTVLPEYTYLLLLPLFLGLSIKFRWARYLLVIMVAYSWTHYFALSLINPYLSPDLESKDLYISGTLANVETENPNYTKILFQLDNTSIKTWNRGIPRNILLYWYKADNNLSVNQACKLKVKLKKFWRLANPGSHDREKVMFLRGIGAHGYIREGTCKDTLKSVNKPGNLRTKLLQKSNKETGSFIHAATMQALTFGERDDLTTAQWDILQKTGTAHLLAISGLHISSIALLVFFIFKLVCKRSAWLCHHISAQRMASVLALLSAGFYAYLAGFSLPTQRALIMVGVALLAVFLYRPVARISVLSTALLLILVINPMSVLHSGFWLSFSAVIFIFCALRASENFKKVSQIIVIQIYLGAALLPLSLLFFQQGSLIAPFANLFAVPWVSFLVLPLLLLAQLLIILGFEFAGGLFHLVDYLLDILWTALGVISSLKYSFVSFHTEYYSVIVYEIGLILFMLSRRFFLKSVSLLLISALFLIKQADTQQGELLLTVLDVGQGLSVLVETDNHSLLFDAGYQSLSGFSMGQAVVSPYLNFRNIDALDVGIVSHNDNDHAGGMYYLLKQDKINKLLVSNRSELYQSNNIGVCRSGDEWSWDGIKFRFLHPDADWVSDDNNRSCVLQIIHPGGKILLTGDIEASTEKVLTQQYGDKLASDIIIVPHHGSKSSSSEVFLSRVHPRFAVFSSAYKNRYGFPHTDILRRYHERGVITVDTQSDGAVMFRIDADNGIQMAPGYRTKSQRYWHSLANASN